MDGINGLKISCDWLSFTISAYDTVYDFMDGIGFTPDMFKKMNKGAQGYKNMLRHKSHEITILYEGNETMGIHCDVKGSAVVYFLEIFAERAMVNTPFDSKAWEVNEFDGFSDAMSFFYKFVLENGWFTRLDLAVDDVGCSYFSCEELRDILYARNYTALFRTWSTDIEYNTDSASALKGYTVYCGSRQSGIFLRVYDKKLEQQKKNPEKYYDAWVRWEFELKDEHADAFAKHILNKHAFGDSVVSLLNGFLRLIVPDDSNRSRCSTLPKWEKFLSGVGKLRLSGFKKKRTVEKSLKWIEKQCMPTIAGLCVANGGTLDFITKNLIEHFNRLSAADKEVYSSYLYDNYGIELKGDGYDN